MTQRIGLIGDPVAHSVSPVFQQAALDALGIDARYEAWQTAAADLGARIVSLRAPHVLGANVTVPHKRAVLPLLDIIEDSAREVGAVNTIGNRGGRLTGANTDVAGFLEALRRDGALDPAGLRVAVLGAGGAARAVVYGLLTAGAAEVLVLNRTAARARALAEELGDGRLSAAEWPAETHLLGALLDGRDLLVNCTSIGMRHSPAEAESPVPESTIPAGAFVAEIVANPLVTPLLRAAQRRRCRTLGGLAMLVRQGAASFQMWTGRPAPLDAMFAAARQAMGLAADP